MNILMRGGDQSEPRGCLYLVATPIGNLEDITLRALRVLRESDLIACEDTRQTQKLMTHYELRKPLISYHEHNEAARAPELLARLQQGAQIALVSDAGTPVVSDPGQRLVSLCAQHGIAVVPVPGPSAAITALAASGLEAKEFCFLGFLPSRSGQRRKALEALADEPRALVIYEAPHRIHDTLKDALEILGDRPAVIARELTKLHEEFIRGRLSDLLDRLEQQQPRGEMTLLVASGSKPGKSKAVARSGDVPLSERVAQIMREGVNQKAALKQAARERGFTRRQAYSEMLRAKAGR